jgi:hypothetical protein
MRSIEFAEAVRRLSGEARRAGYVAPSVQAKPRGTQTRTIRRRNDGTATVTVVLRGRPRPAVLADLVDGVIVANHLSGTDAASLRDVLWSALEPLLVADNPADDPADRSGDNLAGERARASNVVPFAA